jgi:hypothetical protein
METEPLEKHHLKIKNEVSKYNIEGLEASLMHITYVFGNMDILVHYGHHH